MVVGIDVLFVVFGTPTIEYTASMFGTDVEYIVPHGTPKPIPYTSFWNA